MTEFTSQLLLDVEEQLLAIELEAANTLRQAERSINMLQEKLLELRDFITDYQFASQEEEIYFFKEVKPRVYYKLIYYVRVFQVETRLPAGCIELRKKLLQAELKEINDFYRRNLDFYQYCNSNATYLDHEYFLRGKYDPKVALDEYSMLVDVRFCTAHSYKIARIKAYELLQAYLNASLRKLEQQDVTGLVGCCGLIDLVKITCIIFFNPFYRFFQNGIAITFLAISMNSNQENRQEK